MNLAIHTLQQHGRIKVCRAAEGKCPEGVDDALFEVAADGRTEWTHEEWLQVLADLDATQLTIAAWLKKKGHGNGT